MYLNWTDKKVKKLKDKEYTVVFREINVLDSSSLRFFDLSSASNMVRVIEGKSVKKLSEAEETKFPLVIEGTSYRGFELPRVNLP